MIFTINSIIKELILIMIVYILLLCALKDNIHRGSTVKCWLSDKKANICLTSSPVPQLISFKNSFACHLLLQNFKISLPLYMQIQWNNIYMLFSSSSARFKLYLLKNKNLLKLSNLLFRYSILICQIWSLDVLLSSFKMETCLFKSVRWPISN